MIKEFQGEYRWLSNFEIVTVWFDEKFYPSVEHAYMSAKNSSVEWKYFCASTQSPAEVKKKSRTVKLVSNWEDIKVDVMRRCIDEKFKHPFYRMKLINTGDQELQEGNRWNDKFWGVCLKTGQGQNILGKLLMAKRKELQEENLNTKE